MLQNSDKDWAFRTTPQANTDGRVSYWPRGKVLGGSSAINYMLYVRGDPRNYDFWENELGIEGWSYESVLPFFKKSESYMRKAALDETSDAFRGFGGELAVTHMKDGEFETKDVTERFVASCAAAGVKETNDYNASIQTGSSMSQITVKDGVRCDTASAFLFKNGAINRDNLTVIMNTRVTRLVIQGGTCTGVCIRPDSAVGDDECPEKTIRARREVVLSAGAVCSPWILLLSGIGPVDELRKHEIPVAADLPGVGASLSDHIFWPISYEMKPGLTNGFSDKSPFDVAKLIFNYYVRNAGLGMFPW